MKIKILVTALICIIIAGVAMALFRKDNKQPASTAFVVAPPPQIQFVPGTPSGVVFSAQNLSGITAASAANTYSVTPANPEVAVTTFASVLGAGNPRTSLRPAGKNIYWNGEGFSLSYSQSGPRTTISFQHTEGGFQTNQTDPESAARSFLGSILGESFSRYRVAGRETPSVNGNVYGPAAGGVTVLFSYILDDVPVLLANFDPVSASVTVLPGGFVITATLVFPPLTEIRGAETPLTNADGIIQSLNAGLGLLVSAKDNQNDEYGAAPTFSSVTISRASFVYYFDPDTLQLRPGFLLDGVGTNGTNQQSVQYFLFATQ